MIRGWLTVLALIALSQQTAAFTPMLGEDCKAAWDVVTKGALGQGLQFVTKDGWCHVSAPAGFKVDLEWRAEGLGMIHSVDLPGPRQSTDEHQRPYIGKTFPERSRKRSAMMDKIDDWPNSSFPASTKRAVKHLIGTLPAPNGTLRASVDMGAGLPAAVLMRGALLGPTFDDVISGVIDGMVFQATWTAAE